MKLRTLLRRSATAAAGLLAVLLLPGCATLNCENWNRWDDTLNTWVGADVRKWERQLKVNPRRSLDRPQNRIEYEYDTHYVNYDGSRQYCNTWMEVDRDTGAIVGWRYEGECYMHGYCAD